VYKQFVDELVHRAKLLKLGNGLDESVDVGPVVSKAQMETVLGYVEVGKKEGARLATGGKRVDHDDHKHGFFIEPTVFADVDPKMRIAQEEIFGPVVSCIACDSLEDGIAIANDVKYGLSSSLYTKDVNRAFAAIRDLDAGITYINAPTIGAEVHLPFGGVKQTGNGHREGGVGESRVRGLLRPSAKGADRPPRVTPSSYNNRGVGAQPAPFCFNFRHVAAVRTFAAKNPLPSSHHRPCTSSQLRIEYTLSLQYS
jgi:delta 1-pyrroline-5-carboxylate dehydrogenase